MDGVTRLPLARSEGLVVEALGDEALVYDLAVKNAHCLSPTAAAVWRRCDGRTSPSALGLELELSTEQVAQALDELDRSELLVSPVVPGDGLSRRELGLKVTKVAAGAAALPLILSIAAPAAAATASFELVCQSHGAPGSNSCAGCNAPGSPPECCCCHFLGSGGMKKFCTSSQAKCEEIAPELLGYDPSHTAYCNEVDV